MTDLSILYTGPSEGNQIALVQSPEWHYPEEVTAFVSGCNGGEWALADWENEIDRKKIEQRNPHLNKKMIWVWLVMEKIGKK